MATRLPTVRDFNHAATMLAGIYNWFSRSARRSRSSISSIAKFSAATLFALEGPSMISSPRANEIFALQPNAPFTNLTLDKEFERSRLKQ